LIPRSTYSFIAQSIWVQPMQLPYDASSPCWVSRQVPSLIRTSVAHDRWIGRYATRPVNLVARLKDVVEND
jgi:hypothetical protein